MPTKAGSLATLEQSEARLDETLWRREILALRCERVLNQLWDSLRNGSRLSEAVSRFPIGEFSEPVVERTRQLQHEIKEISFHPGDRPMVNLPAELRQWEEDGYRLELSDWRQPSFHLSEQACGSVVHGALYVSHDTEPGRWLLRFELEVSWKMDSLMAGQPEMEKISWRKMNLLARTLPPPFRRVARQEFTLPPGLETLDANLMVEDLDRDGLPEIIIGTANLLLWNKGNRFTPDDLFVDPRIKAYANLIGDFDRDGIRDLLIASPEGVWKLKGKGDGKFVDPQLCWKAEQPLMNPFVMTSGDLNGDGAPEVWLAQYKLPFVEGQMPTPFFNANDGFPSHLLANDGAGNFKDATREARLESKRFRRTYSASFLDLDADADLDLLVVSDFYGVDIHQNQGQGRFKDVTSEWVEDPNGFGMAHAIADWNADGLPDILMVGMTSEVASRMDQWRAVRPGFEDWLPYRSRMTSGNKLFLGGNKPWKLDERSAAFHAGGWAWGVTVFDFDNDSDQEVYMVNGHISRGTTADYESEFWRHDIYVGSSEHDEIKDQYFIRKANALGELSYGGFWKNAFFLNHQGTEFKEVSWLMGLAEEIDCRDVVSADLNQDGKLDLVFTSFEHWPRLRQMLHIYLNQSEAGNWIGFHLQEAAGTTLPGTRVQLFSDNGPAMSRWMVQGDSYHAQHPAIAHFGLGSLTKVDRAEIHYPNGRKKVLHAPAVNNYHNVAPD